jgi:hypothetical protein
MNAKCGFYVLFARFFCARPLACMLEERTAATSRMGHANPIRGICARFPPKKLCTQKLRFRTKSAIRGKTVHAKAAFTPSARKSRVFPSYAEKVCTQKRRCAENAAFPCTPLICVGGMHKDVVHGKAATWCCEFLWPSVECAAFSRSVHDFC